MAVDTSAIIAIALDEAAAERCAALLERPNERFVMSAGTLVEVQIVAARKSCQAGVEDLLQSILFEIIDVTKERAHLAATAYTHWGKTFHSAGLNFGDCFAYATAKEFDCPLLFVGDDFAQTDVTSAIAPASP